MERLPAVRSAAPIPSTRSRCGRLYGNGTDDILFRNDATGDTWFEAMNAGAPAGWHQVGGSDTRFSVVGVGDYFGNGTSDILYRNNASGVPTTTSSADAERA